MSGIALVFFETAANTLFLIRYDTAQLPIIYIITALISIIFGYLYTKLEEKITISKLLKITLAFLFIIIILSYGAIWFFNNDQTFIALMVIKNILWIFAGIEFGILCGIIFNIRQNKKYYGFIISGEVLAGIVGGFSITILMHYISTTDLFIISAITILLSFLLLISIINRFQSRFITLNNSKNIDEDEQKVKYKEILKNNYFQLYFGLAVLAFFIFYFIDYLFYFKVEERFTNEKDLATFFGIFIAILNIVSFLSSLFISGKVLNRFGILIALSVIPFITIVGTSSYLFFSTISLAIAFFILIALKLLTKVSEKSILSPTYKILTQSISVKYRRKVLTIRETMVEPIAMGITGASLLLLNSFESAWMISVILLILATIWLFYARYLRDSYVESLKSLLAKRQLVGDISMLGDIDIKFLLEKLKSENILDIIYALEFLEKLNYTDIEEELRNLLIHDNTKVRIKAIQTISNLNITSLIKQLETQLLNEKNTKVVAALIQIYCKFEKEKAKDIIKDFLYSKELEIRDSAIISLLKYCGVDGILVASKIINSLINENTIQSHIEVLNIISDAPFYGFYDFIDKSLNSDSVELKNKAVLTVGNLKLERFINKLLNLLQDEESKTQAFQALENFEDIITDRLIKEFNNNNSYEMKFTLIKLLSKIKDEKSIKFLFSLTKYNKYIYNVINSLAQANFITKDKGLISNLQDELIEKIIDNRIKLFTFDKKRFPNSFNVLNGELNRKMDTIFNLLSFIYTKETLTQAKVNYNSGSKDLQALAIELLDNMIDKRFKKSLIPILENITSDSKCYNLLQNSKYKTQILTFEEYLTSTINDLNMELTVRLSFIYEIGKYKEVKYLDLIKQIDKKDKNLYISETTKWCIEQLNKKGKKDALNH